MKIFMISVMELRFTAVLLMMIVLIGSASGEVSEEEMAPSIKQGQETQEEYDKRVQDSIRSLMDAQAKLNHVRGFTIKVIDQDGRPVPGVKVQGYSKKFLRIVHPTGRIFDSEDFEAVTDPQGIARTKRVEGGAFHITLNENELPKNYDGKDSIDFVGVNPDLTGRADRTDRSRLIPGVDWIFNIHRFTGPNPLLERSGSTVSLRPEGNVLYWSLLHPLFAHEVWVKEIKEKANTTIPPMADFKIRFWRNPKSPWTNEDPNAITMMNGKDSRLINVEEPWWVELEVVRGGLQPVEPPAAPPELTTTAPATSYMNRVVIASDGSEPIEIQGRQRWYWWRRSGQPTRYALVAFKLMWMQGYDDPTQVDIKMSATMFINPTPNDRLIERPISRRATWITDLKDDLATQWIAEPAGDPDPTIEQVEPRAIPSP